MMWKDMSFVNIINNCKIRLKGIYQIILNYNKLMIRFFKIMAGGHSYLQKDIQLTINNGSTLHLDILQRYSDFRHYVKKSVRDDWQFPCDPSVSKSLIKLFQL